MSGRLRRLAGAVRRRFNPRLHPLLAVGIGLGVAALLLPDPDPFREAHSDAEILERLVGPTPDLDHGPGFWLRQIRGETDLYRQARELCRRPETALRPNCRMLGTLERIGRPGAPPITPQGDPSGWTPSPR